MHKIAKYNIIVMTDMNGGISIDGAPPKNIQSWTKYFREKTTGPKKNNAVIMGRKTYELLCSDQTFLPNRENYIISNILDQKDYNSIIIYKSFLNCLAGIANRNKYDEIWVIGGSKVFNECLRKYLPYCSKIIHCKMYNECYDCDLFFPFQELKNKNIEGRVENKNKEYEIIHYYPNISHQETQYLNLLENIINNGDTCIQSRSDNFVYKKLENQNLCFNISTEIPIFTTRYVDYNDVINTFVDDINNLDFTKDDIGFRMRSKSKFTGIKNYSETGDQLETLIQELTDNQIYTLGLEKWNELNEYYVPSYIRFSVTPNKKDLNVSISCVKMESFKHLPYYCIYISLLTSSIAYIMGLVPRNMHWHFSEIIIPNQYMDYCKKIIQNDPKPWANLTFKNISNIKSLFDIKKENIEIRNYESWLTIKFK